MSHFPRMCIFPEKKETAPPPKHMGCLHGWPWLAWLTSPRIGLARLACTSNNSSGATGNRAAGAEGSRRPTCEGRCPVHLQALSVSTLIGRPSASFRASRAAAVVAGAGKASEVDARRGEPSEPGHVHATHVLLGLSRLETFWKLAP